VIHRIFPVHFLVPPAILLHVVLILVVPCWTMALQNVLVYLDTLKVPILLEDACQKPTSANLIHVVLERDATVQEYRLVIVQISRLEIHTRVAEVIIISIIVYSIK